MEKNILFSFLLVILAGDSMACEKTIVPSDISLQRKGAWYLPLEVSQRFSIYPNKIWYFVQDAYFRQGYEFFRSHIGSDESLIDFFKRYTFLILRPDAIQAHAIKKAVDTLHDNGFEVVDYLPFKFNRHTNRALYWYHLNHAPKDRFELVDMFINDKTSVMLILNDMAQTTQLFACQRLAKIKGHILKTKRISDSIRAKINAESGLLAFIHAPDEPLDIIRELTILFEQSTISSIITAWLRATPCTQIESLEAQLYNNHEPYHFNLFKAIIAIESAIKKQCQGEVQKLLLSMCQLAREGNKIDWQKFISVVKEKSIQIDEWDLLTFSAYNAADELPMISSLYL